MFSLIFGGVGWVRLGWVGLGWVGLGWPWTVTSTVSFYFFATCHGRGRTTFFFLPSKAIVLRSSTNSPKNCVLEKTERATR